MRYGRVLALDNLDLRVAEGEIVALLGANGAGKTTALRAVAGLAAVSGGQIYFERARLDTQPAHRRPRLGLALVPEGRQVFADQSVVDNLRLGAYHRFYRGADAEIRADVGELLDRFPALAARRETAAGALSGGEQQQLAIARALMARPRLLLLDEPSLGLAPLLVDAVFEIISELRRTGTTILLVEQRAYQALDLADRAYVLRLGRCVLSGPAKELRANPRLEAAYLGSAE